jgi:hypothetical protein
MEGVVANLSENSVNNTKMGSSNRSYFKLALLIFLALNLIVLFFIVYLLVYNKDGKLSLVEERNEIPIKTGVVEVERVDDRGGALGTKFAVVATATGEVYRQELFDNEVGEKIAEADVVRFSLVDGLGNQRKINMVIQIVPTNLSSNIIPWYLQEAYRFKENKIKSDTTPEGIDEIVRLFDSGSIWIINLLLRNNMNEGLLEGSEYVEFSKRYYSNDDWEILDQAISENFQNFEFDKPLLIQRIQYLSF